MVLTSEQVEEFPLHFKSPLATYGSVHSGRPLNLLLNVVLTSPK